MRAVWRTLLVAPTLPVEALLWWLALCWLVTLALTPDSAFTGTHMPALLRVKALWVWPAVAAAVLPPLTALAADRWRGLVYAARLYKLAWWLFLTLALLALAPAFLVFWGPPLAAVVASVWLLVRSAAGSPRPGPG